MAASGSIIPSQLRLIIADGWSDDVLACLEFKLSRRSLKGPQTGDQF